MNTQKYLLQADCGTYPPRYIHDSIDSAVDEAKRLHTLLKTNVKILKVIGEVKFIQVPVVETKTKIEIYGETNIDLELPF